MAENTQVGSALGYDELLSQLQSSIADRVVGKSSLDKATDVLNKLTTTHLMLSQFGFYKKITDQLKGLGKEAVDNLKSKAEAISNVGENSGFGIGKEMTSVANPVAPINEGYDPAQGVFSRVIGRDAPEPQVDSEITGEGQVLSDPVDFTGRPQIGALRQFEGRTNYDPNKPLFDEEAGLPQLDLESQAPLFFGQRSGNVGVVRRGGVPEPPQEAPPAPQAPPPRPVEGEAEDVANAPRQAPVAQEAPALPEQLPQTFEEFATQTTGEARAVASSLGQTIAKSDARISFQQSIGSYLSKAQDLKTSLESGVQRINSLRNQATTAFNNIKSEGEALQQKGQSLLSQGRDALARGDQTGQSLIDQGNDLLAKGVEQAKNSDLANQAVSQAQQKIQQGSDLLAQGKQEGQAFIDQGRDLLKSAQSQVQGYGQQAEQIGQALQSEVEQRTAQLADIAGQAKEAFTAGKSVAGALASGDTQAFVEGGQALGKTVGSLAGKALGEETGDAIGAGISSAIPVIGEVVDAGLLLSTLFTGIADAFQPHHLPTFIDTATQQYGI
jgi:hypothetical protein